MALKAGLPMGIENWKYWYAFRKRKRLGKRSESYFMEWRSTEIRYSRLGAKPWEDGHCYTI